MIWEGICHGHLSILKVFKCFYSFICLFVFLCVRDNCLKFPFLWINLFSDILVFWWEGNFSWFLKLLFVCLKVYFSYLFMRIFVFAVSCAHAWAGVHASAHTWQKVGNVSFLRTGVTDILGKPNLSFECYVTNALESTSQPWERDYVKLNIYPGLL